MIRKIKFRAWDIAKKKYKYPKLWDNTMPSNWESHYVLQQFTGLLENAYETDNKEIYEGDIIEFINSKRLVVEWNDDTCKFQFSDGTDINDGERYSSHKMIVGNIYENPELLN